MVADGVDDELRHTGERGCRLTGTQEAGAADHDAAVIDDHADQEALIAGGHERVAELVHRDSEVIELGHIEPGATAGFRGDEPYGPEMTRAWRNEQADLILVLHPGPRLTHPSQSERVGDTRLFDHANQAARAIVCRMMAADIDEVLLRFPARPEYLRLARLAAADVATRAGFDYEEIEDLRIAVSELCAMLSSDGGAELSLTFSVAPESVTVGGSSPHAGGQLATEDMALAQALVAAVVDEHVLSTDGDVSSFHLVKRRSGPSPA